MTIPQVEIQEETKALSQEKSAHSATSNVLECLKSNIDRLEELHSRLQFMLGEIKILIRK